MTDMTSNIANDAIYINDSNESTEGYTMYEILDNLEETTGITSDIHIVSISINKTSIIYFNISM